MNSPFTYSPFDDASGKRLLVFLNQHGGLFGFTVVAAAGSTLDDAAGLSLGWNFITNDNAAKGARLPSVSAGTVVAITNDGSPAGHAVNVYPSSASELIINTAVPGAPDTIAAGNGIIYLKVSNTDWASLQ